MSKEICPICHEDFNYCPHMLEEAFRHAEDLRKQLEAEEQMFKIIMSERNKAWEDNKSLRKQLEENRNYKNGYETALLMLDDKDIEIITLRKQLEVAKDKFNKITLLEYDEDIDTFEGMIRALRNIARNALAEIEKIGEEK